MLAPCSACGATISGAAAACPRCGHPVPKPSSALLSGVRIAGCLAVFAAVGIGVAGLLFGGGVAALAVACGLGLAGILAITVNQIP